MEGACLTSSANSRGFSGVAIGAYVLVDPAEISLHEMAHTIRNLFMRNKNRTSDRKEKEDTIFS